MGAMLYFPEYPACMALLINDNNQVCISSAALGLWLVLKYHHAKSQFAAAAFAVILFTSMFVLWPAGYLINFRRTRQRTAAIEQPDKMRFAHVARLLAVSTGLIFLAATMLYALYLVNPQGQLTWGEGKLLVRALFLLVWLGVGLSAVLALCAFRVWQLRYWSVLGRVHYTLISLAAFCVDYVFAGLGLLTL